MKMRKTVIVMHDTKRKCIHFASTKLQGDNVWLPYNCESGPLFPIIENLMVLNKIASNVTGIERIRRCGTFEDFQVMYNKSKS